MIAGMNRSSPASQFGDGGALTIAAAEREDLALWIEMRSQLWPEMSEEELGAELAELLEQEGYCGWIARLHDQVVGFAEASLRPYANGCEGRPVPFLEGVWVEPKERSKGIGGALVRAVEAWALGRGYDELGSDVDIANLISQAAHQAWGFEERETVVYYRRKLAR